MTTTIRERAHRRDRWVNWIVLAVLILGLVGGWWLKTTAEGRSTAFEVEGIRGRYPAGWLLLAVDPPTLFQASDLFGPQSATSLTLQRRPMPEHENPLAIVQQNLAMERTRNWMAYRTLQIKTSASIAGRTGTHTTFAYVETNPDPTMEVVPVVVRGEDFIFAAQSGDWVYVATLTAAETEYSQAQKALRSFLRSLQE
jgi:hypothetical protein